MDLQNIKHEAVSEFRVDNITNPIHEQQAQLSLAESTRNEQRNKDRRSNSTMSPASGAGNVSESMMMSQVGTVREIVCA